VYRFRYKKIFFGWSQAMSVWGSHGGEFLKITVFWVLVQCSMEEIYQSFRGICCVNSPTMEAASTSETLVNFYQTTWRWNPEDIRLRPEAICALLSFYRLRWLSDLTTFPSAVWKVNIGQCWTRTALRPSKDFRFCVFDVFDGVNSPCEGENYRSRRNWLVV
jgi:hypothetical protein